MARAIMETAMSLDTAKKAPSESAGGGKRVWLQRITAWSAAAVLLAAAILKAWPLATGQAIESQAASLLKLLLIQGEVLLALWLISGIGAAWAFRAALVFFAGAATVNLRSIWLGETSCGCFGKLEVPPAASLGINVVVILGMLSASKTTRLELARSNRLLCSPNTANATINVIGLFLLFCAPFVCLLVLNDFSLYVQRHSRNVDIYPPLLQMEAGYCIDDKQEVIRLTNVGTTPIEICRVTPSCSCIKILMPTSQLLRVGDSLFANVGVDARQLGAKTKLVDVLVHFKEQGNEGCHTLAKSRVMVTSL